MATSSNGLRFMWLPGKKKHNAKGQYNTTKKSKNSYTPYKASNIGGQKQRKNEPWSLGGSRGQRKLLGTENDVGGSGADAGDLMSGLGDTGHAVCETTLAAASHACGAVAVASTSTTPTLEVIPCSSKENGAVKSCNLNGDKVPDACGCDDEDEHEKCSATYHNATTLARGDKVKRSTDDLDSIERLGESKTNLNGDLDHDVTDTASTSQLHVKKTRKRNKSKKKSAKIKDRDKPEPQPDDKLVDCLYYSVVLCDCSIS